MKKRGMSNLTMALIGLAVMIVFSVVLIASSEPLYKTIAGRNRPVSETPIYNPGIYEGDARGYGGNVTVKIEVTEYEIKDVKISAPDETPEIGKSVAVNLEKEIWKNQSQNLDSVSGATMTSNAVKKAYAMCLRQAAKEGTELAKIIEAELAEENSEKMMPEIEELLKTVPDGTYQYKEETEDGNGFYNVINVTVAGKQITALIWDAVKEDGTGKRALSESGNYTMTENGLIWSAQADMLAQYVLENQSVEELMNEGGTSDSVSSVSIHVGGFIDTLKKCLAFAGGDMSHMSISELLKMTPDGTYSYLGETADDKGFKDQIQLSVKNHEITALIWDCVNAEGTGKRILSEEGQYNMTDNGPKWYEQADALAAYLIKNQTDQGLMDESGYVASSAADQGVDVVASVSIYIGGFTDAVKKCLIQSSN